MTTHRSARSGHLATVAALSMLLATAACSSDSGDSSEAGATTTALSSEVSAPAGAPDGYCDASLAIEASPGPDIDFSTASEAEIAAAVKGYAAGELRELFDAVAEVAPTELDDAIATYDDAITSVAETGDSSVFETPELLEAEATVHGYDLDHCGWEQIDVVTTDYAFGGVPKEIEAGTVSFEFDNEGKELHELVLLRINDDVDLTADELLALPQEEAETMVQPAGGTDPIPPGSSNYLVASLEAGRYLVTCFLPEGATSFEAMESLGEDAPPHAMHGMVQEVTVS